MLYNFRFILTFQVPESPRWLLENGRGEEARVTLIKIAKFNRIQVSETLLKELDTNLASFSKIDQATECQKKG